MTGRIKSLSTLSPSGFITAASGLDVYFHSSEVLPPGAGGLAVGQLVTYDVGGGKWPSAINVRVPAQPVPPRATPHVAERCPPAAYLQYMGFEQTGSTRAYRFRRVLRGEETRELVVSADLALFGKHHVGFQEGPALSLRLLSADPDGSSRVEWLPAQTLTDVDMLAYVAGRAVETKPRRHQTKPA
jgi:cold shock CspA family protein